MYTVYPVHPYSGGLQKIEGRRFSTLYFSRAAPEFVYTLHNTRNGKSYFSCTSRGCVVRGRCEDLDQVFGEDLGRGFVTKNHHNHIGDASIVANLRFSSACKRRAAGEPTAIRRIYDEEKARHPDATLEYRALENALYKTQRRTRPAQPTCLADLRDLPSRYMSTLRGTPFFSRRSDAGQSLVFVSPDVGAHARHCKVLFVDASYRAVPGLFSCLVTLHVPVSSQTVPAAYCLLGGRTEQDLAPLVQHLKETLALAPALLVCDFLLPLQRVLARAFPQARVTGSFFHYTQVVWKRTQVLGLASLYHTDHLTGRVVRKALALPLLPPHMMAQGLSDVEEDAREGIEELGVLCDHLKVLWVGRVGPQELSMSGAPERTCSVFQDFHREASKLSPSGGLYPFLERLQRLEDGYTAKFTAITA
ncbi:uncharacterized protein LOC108671346, partial [Hyalella azteca]|uniref:Uncharacterized protein LOC108671346 n=1 Tax=Hyalella azteca TaxID=294128 RepID=A0A979FX99_HYAAZ